MPGIIFSAAVLPVPGHREMLSRWVRGSQLIAGQWLKGKHGGIMQVFSKKDGKKLAYLRAFDGLVAANVKLYMVTEHGSILCYEGK